MSRDSQHFRISPNISPNISGMGKATNVELVNKTKMLNMRSLTNKTANIKYKNLSVYKTVFVLSTFLKKRFLLFWICDSVALTQFCKLISFCI